MSAAAYAPAELVKLGEAETLGMVEDHDGGVWDIHAHLDHAGGNERVDFSLAEKAHDALLLLRPEFAVEQAHLVIGQAFDPLLKGRWRTRP